MTSSADLIRYLRDCYLADSRGGGVLDLFAKKIEHRYVLPAPEELLAGVLDPASVPRADCGSMAAAAAVYQRERVLLYCAFPLVGRIEPAGDGGPPLRLCAPLLTCPAGLYDEPGFPESLLALTVLPHELRVNFPALATLLGDEGAASEVTEAVLAVLPDGPLDPPAAASLARTLEDRLPGLDASALRRFPELASEEELRRAVRTAGRGDGGLVCLPACAVALVPRSFESRGVLHELSAIADSPRSSPPLRLLLAGSEDADGGAEAERSETPGDREPGPTPAVLSRAQRRALASAARNPLTVVIGPPGTGKSYTLAAMALQHVARGEPVLVASRTDQALEVVASKIEEILGERTVVLRGGRGRYLAEMKDALEQILHGRLPWAPPAAAPARRPGRREARDAGLRDPALRRVERSLDRLERELTRRAELEKDWGRFSQQLAAESGARRLGSALARGWCSWRLGRLPPYDRQLQRYEELLEERNLRVAAALRGALHLRLHRCLAEHRPQLQRFLKALRARQSARQEELFAGLDREVLLRAFPLWMVSFADVHQVVPLEPELFSLVIVDEATQSDPATCLPVLYRARRAVVTGDPKQLRHVSFLARSRQRAIGERHGLSGAEVEAFDYRGKSLLDLATDALRRQDQVAFLDEHFRSTPRIIGFSNRHFYRGALRVMTRRPETEESRSLFVRRVAGRRLPAGHNPEEAAALVADLAARVEREARLPAAVCHSLGVLSPFREQAEHLREEVERALGFTALERHRVLVGTPYAFQGEERDVMLLSLALDPSSPAGSFRYLERADVFNVAVTRARAAQVLFCSLDPDDAPAGGLLHRYLSYAAEGPGASAPPDGEPRDRFLAEVREALEAAGFRTWPAYVVAGFPVDLVAAKDGKSLGIDLVGHPGAFADAFDLERCRMLQRAGLELFPLSFFAWRRDPGACLAAVAARIAEPSG